MLPERGRARTHSKENYNALQMLASCTLDDALCSVIELLCDMSCVCKDKLKVTVIVSPTMDR